MRRFISVFAFALLWLAGSDAMGQLPFRLGGATPASCMT
jgi:hypothetical protein